MNKILRLIRWFIPIGIMIKSITRRGSNGRGKLVWDEREIPLHRIWYTPFKGVFLVYSETEYKKEINCKIHELKKEIEGLEGCIR